VSVLGVAPAEGHAGDPQDGEQSMRCSRRGHHQLWQALREEAARTVRLPAHASPYRQLDANRAWAPGKVRQVALIPTPARPSGGRRRLAP
jgi:hypothetical protein